MLQSPSRAPRSRVRRSGIPLLAGIVALGVIAAPGSLAYLQSQATTGGMSVVTGSAGLEITAGVAVTPSPRLGPSGERALLFGTPPTVTNTGDVPLAITAAVSAAGATPQSFATTASFALSLIATGGACTPIAIGAGGSGGPGSTVWEGGHGTANTAVLGTLGPGESRALCAQVGLPTSAPSSAASGQATAFTFTLTGNQVHP